MGAAEAADSTLALGWQDACLARPLSMARCTCVVVAVGVGIRYEYHGTEHQRSPIGNHVVVGPGMIAMALPCARAGRGGTCDFRPEAITLCSASLFYGLQYLRTDHRCGGHVRSPQMERQGCAALNDRSNARATCWDQLER